MGEQRLRRPPPAGQQHSLGRAGAVVGGRHGDEESMRDELLRLQKLLAEIRYERDTVVRELRKAENDSLHKDKLLQELLATAKIGPGVPSEALDQLREDLQMLLQVKHHAVDARLLLEEKEDKIARSRQELRTTSVSDMENDVNAAKMDAKTKINNWEDQNEGHQGTQCYTNSMESQYAAQLAVQEIEEVEGEIVRTQRVLTKLLDENTQLEKSVQSNCEKVKLLEEKQEEIDQQREQSATHCDLAELEERRQQAQLSLENKRQELTRAREEGMEARLRDIVLSNHKEDSDVAWEVSDSFFSPCFTPLLREFTDSEAHALLWRCRHALEAGQRKSGLDLLAADVMDGAGQISTDGLACCLHSLRVPCAEQLAVQSLVSSLDPGLVGFAIDGAHLISIADIILALPLQPALSVPEDLPAVMEAIAWSCRRRGITERDVRSRFAAWLADGFTDLPAVASDFCRSDLGLGDSSGHSLGRALEVMREDIGDVMPSWRCCSATSRAALLASFVQDIASRPDNVLPLLDVEEITLESFFQVAEVTSFLGQHWSREDLVDIALLTEDRCAGGNLASPGAAPLVAAACLARAAASPPGFGAEFPEEAALLAAQLDSCVSLGPEALPATSGAPALPVEVQQDVVSVGDSSALANASIANGLNIKVSEQAHATSPEKPSEAPVEDEEYEDEFDEEEYEDEFDEDVDDSDAS